MESLFAQVWEGLSRPFDQKFIPSVHFYDEWGSQLFTQCENLPEYYLTRCEMSILRDPHTVQRMQKLLSLSNPSHLTLVDLGAGDGCKTLGFLKQWCSQAEQPALQDPLSTFRLISLLRRAVKLQTHSSIWTGHRTPHREWHVNRLLVIRWQNWKIFENNSQRRAVCSI